MCQGRSTPCIGDGHPTFNRNPYNGYINPYYWVDDHPLLYGNNGSLDPGTCLIPKRPNPKFSKGVILLMVQKSGVKTTWDGAKPCKSCDELPTSTGETAGFLSHQQYETKQWIF